MSDKCWWHGMNEPNEPFYGHLWFVWLLVAWWGLGTLGDGPSAWEVAWRHLDTLYCLMLVHAALWRWPLSPCKIDCIAVSLSHWKMLEPLKWSHLTIRSQWILWYVDESLWLSHNIELLMMVNPLVFWWGYLLSWIRRNTHLTHMRRRPSKKGDQNMN